MVRSLFIPALFRSMLAHRLRLALTGLAIALGVACLLYTSDAADE